MLYNLLKKSFNEHGDKVAVNCDDIFLTFRELDESIRAISCELESRGVNKGDHVAILMNNCIEFPEAFFAISLCGAVIVPFYVNMGIHKLTKTINHYDIKFVITTSKYEGEFETVLQKECCFLKGIFYLDFKKLSYMEFHDHLQKEAGKFDSADMTDLALILFSSGTTNLPKGIMLSNSNISSNVEAISNYLKIGLNDNVLLIKNIVHVSSIIGEMIVSLYNGCTLIMSSSLATPKLILELIDRYQITIFFAVPTILYSILNYRYLNKFSLKSMKTLQFYGGSIGTLIIRELAAAFPWANLIYSYGLTEAAPRVTYCYKDKLLEKEGTSGTPVQGVEVFILDKEGVSLGAGEMGEIAVKGPNVMLGYYKDRELSDRVLRDGILHTGDLGCLDKDGYLFVTGRRDNLIKQSGKNIYPEEIENVLAGYKGVLEVLVRGEQDDLLGQKVTAYIVPVDDYLLDILEILKYCRLHLEDYKIPKEVIIVKELDKTPSEKIVRRQEL
ncbi:MAG: class I adenylate-forming enzyme family protein [Bacillota bacterium]|nr:class I adenylate-forming enzyme family protein [Bacillota bacterium]